MDITFFLRSKQGAISIGKLFRPLIAEIGKTENVETYYMPSATYGVKGMLQNLWFTFKHRNKKGINHITGECHFIILALLGCKTVLTIHDLGFYVDHKHEMSWLKRKFIYYLQIYWPIKLADKVIAISEKTKQEILETVPFKRKIDFAKHVSIDAFPYTPKKMYKNHIRIMQCGTAPQKNLETTIKALQGMECELRVVREMTEKQKKLAKECGVAYTNVYNLTDEEMTAEYQNADIICMPSLYEGFGAMVIEGQATGRPVITTDLEPMKSISGGAAHLLKNPKDESELKTAIQKIINDDDYRTDLIERGKENASKYKLENCAKEHLEIYKLLNIK